MSLETEVVSEVKAVETKVETIADAVVADVKAEVSKVEPTVKAAVVKIKAEESLVLREAELEYLKAQVQIKDLTKITEEKAKSYQTYIESLFKTYVLDKAEYVFDGTINAFKKL
jgi:hypothetical protein